jgi:hypothetical protein
LCCRGKGLGCGCSKVSGWYGFCGHRLGVHGGDTRVFGGLGRIKVVGCGCSVSVHGDDICAFASCCRFKVVGCGLIIFSGRFSGLNTAGRFVSFRSDVRGYAKVVYFPVLARALPIVVRDLPHEV